MALALLFIAALSALPRPAVGENEKCRANDEIGQARILPQWKAIAFLQFTGDENVPQEDERPEQQSKWWPPPSPWDMYWPTLGLVIFGALAFGVGVRTMIAIERQTKALTDAERAWVIVRFSQQMSSSIMTSASTDVNGEMRESSGIHAFLKFTNVGKAPCWITHKRVWFKIVEAIPPEPDFTSPPSLEDTTLAVYTPSDESDDFGGQLTCKGTHVISLSPKGGSNCPIIYGYFRYRDPFGENRETRFGYRLRGSRFERIASIAYNNTT
jgi:hypothetical protein